MALKRLPRKEAALLRFLKGTRITPSQVENAPNVTSCFPNRQSVLAAIRFSQEPAVLSFLQVYDATPACDRKQISFEAIALKAGSNFNELLGAMMFSFRSLQAQKSAAIAMEAHPGIVAATTKLALRPKFTQDRKMIHEAVGFLPTPKGQSINLNFPGQANKDESNDGDASAPDIDQLFPRIARKQEDWQSDRTRMLEGDR